MSRQPQRISGLGVAPLRADGLPVDVPVIAQPAPWWAHTITRLAVFLAVFAAIGLAGLGISYLVDPTGPADGAGALVTALGLIVAAAVSYLVMTSRQEGRMPVELEPRRISGLFGGLALGAALVLTCAAIAWALGGLVVDGSRPITDIPWLHDVIMTGVFAAVVEEILFRGLVYRFIEQWMGTWIAVGASAIIFGSAHILADNATLISTLATIVEAGVLFAVIYVLTRSLWWVIGVHAAWNSVLSNVLGIPVSGNENIGLLITHRSGSDIISGGAYGLEAGAGTVALLTTVAVIGLYIAHRRGLRWCRGESSARPETPRSATPL